MKTLIISCTALFILFGFTCPINAQSETSKQNPCKGYPQDESCCKKSGGTWVLEGGYGFCYVNIETDRVTKDDCANTGGDAIKLSDGSYSCVPEGVKVISGKIIADLKQHKAFMISSNGTNYTIKTGSMKTIPAVNQLVDVFYIVSGDGSMRATTVKSAKSNSSD